MNFRFRLVTGLLAFFLSAPPSCLASDTLVEGPQGDSVPFGDTGVEQTYRIPMHPPKAPNSTLLLEATVFRPNDGASHPTVIINHGKSGNGQDQGKGRARFEAASHWFLSHGWTVILPMRRGYAASEGEIGDGMGSCDENVQYVDGAKTGANDIQAAVTYARKLPFVDPDRLLVVGQSVGGWDSLALAGRNLPGVRAEVVFSPGIRKKMGDSPGVSFVDSSDPGICERDRMVDAARGFGRTAKAPILWMHSENDTLFSSFLSKDLFNAFVSGGMPAQYVEMPSYNKNGHAVLISPDALDHWTGPMESFLRTQGLWQD